jgi:DNA-binding protein HU-beta
MTKRELVRALAERTKLAGFDAARVVDALFDAQEGIIPEQIRAGGVVTIAGFGRFGSKTRPARTGRDPRTGREIEIDASTSPTFKPGRGLRNAVLGEPRKPVKSGPVLRGGKHGPKGTSSAGPRREPTVRGTPGPGPRRDPPVRGGGG